MESAFHYRRALSLGVVAQLGNLLCCEFYLASKLGSVDPPGERHILLQLGWVDCKMPGLVKANEEVPVYGFASCESEITKKVHSCGVALGGIVILRTQ